jgi:prolyl 4-hydroxylase
MRSLGHIAGGVGVLLALSTGALGVTDGQAQVPVEGGFVCEHPPYKIHMVSKSPLVIYVTDFLTDSERAHLREATSVSPLF